MIETKCDTCKDRSRCNETRACYDESFWERVKRFKEWEKTQTDEDRMKRFKAMAFVQKDEYLIWSMKGD